MRYWMRLFCIIMVIFFAGCMASSKSGSTTGALPEEPMPMLTSEQGRFLEKDITPAQLVSGEMEPYTVVPNVDGSVDLIMQRVDTGELCRYSFKDETWKENPFPWVEEITRTYGTPSPLYSHVSFNEKGDCYLRITDKESTNRLLLIRGAEIAEIPVLDWTAFVPETILKSVIPLKSGALGLSYDGDRVGEVLEADGTIRPAAEDGKATGGVFAGDSYVAVQKQKLLFYDCEKGKLMQQLLPGGNMKNAALTSDAQGNLYIATPTGIERLPQGGSLFETITEGAYLFSGGASEIVSLYRHPEQDIFYMLLRNGNVWILSRYRYDAENSPDTTFHVFSMEESGTLRRTMIELQSAYPNITVNYQIGEESALSEEEIFVSLGKALRDGKGPDVLILDGIPPSVYEGSLLELEKPAQECFEAVLNTGVSNGLRYAIPTRFLIRLGMGEKGHMEAQDPVFYSSVVTGRRGLEVLIGNVWQRSNSLHPSDTVQREFEAAILDKLSPTLVVGINKASKQQSLAKTWIDTMLSSYVQQGDFEEGMPIYTSSFDSVVTSALDYTKQAHVLTDLKSLCLSSEALQTDIEKLIEKRLNFDEEHT